MRSIRNAYSGKINFKPEYGTTLTFLDVPITYARAEFRRVGRYTRSTPTNHRTYDDCPLVIYPTKVDTALKHDVDGRSIFIVDISGIEKEGTETLKAINMKLWDVLQQFNKEHDTNYQFTEDIDPTAYEV